MNAPDQLRATLNELAESSAERYRTAEDRVAAVVRGAVSSGLFRPGQRLRQDALAELLHVSRMPVRAALRQLESEGLVELVPHRGAIVRRLTPEEIQDLYEMRILIESYALRKTVAAMTPESMAELEDLAERMDGEPSSSGWFRLRDDFYRRLYAVGNTPRAVTLIMQFRAEVGIHTESLGHQRGDAHRPLLEHVAHDDPELAASWLETHLRSVAASIRDRFASDESSAREP